MAFEDRATYFIAQRARPLAVSLVIAGLLCLVAAGYVFATPTVETVSEERNVQSMETDVDTEAVVTGNTTLYDRGTTLRNRSVYFTSVSPELTFVTRTSGPDGRLEAVGHTLAIETVGLRDDRPFFSERRTLIEATSTPTNGTVTHRATVNVSRIREALLARQAVVGGAGQFRITVVVNTTYETDRYDGTYSTTTPFVLSGQAYYLEEQPSAEETRSRTVTREVRQPPTPFEYGGIGVLGLVLILLSATVVRIERTADPETLRVNIVHDRNEEWISRGEFPTESDKQYISILTLEDLVDVAIDSGRRVIFDPELDAYAVIDGDEIYYYAHDAEETDMWLEF
ncbi:DUF5305 family protein [Halobaculum roseum]|uniref:DUF5305 family protein n=1 Tax=Halobaculum roseum TaxID=2175149 RepID=A0ABD5MT03_9EURY|nr:DUF5305 family protein [Halobaculum roseum]QZY03127.1 DUF5305 domain-containing protein [Halobaculum roseum]